MPLRPRTGLQRWALHRRGGTETVTTAAARVRSAGSQARPGLSQRDDERREGAVDPMGSTAAGRHQTAVSREPQARFSCAGDAREVVHIGPRAGKARKAAPDARVAEPTRASGR